MTPEESKALAKIRNRLIYEEKSSARVDEFDTLLSEGISPAVLMRKYREVKRQNNG